MSTAYSFKHRETVVLAAPAASVTISGLSDLAYQVDGYIVNDGNTKVVSLRLNGDTGTTYNRQQIGASSTTAAGERVTGDTDFNVNSTAVLAASEAMSFEAVIVKPAASTKAQGVMRVGYNTSPVLELFGYEWSNTDALVTSITILASSNNFAASTSIAVFGASVAGTGGGDGDWTRLASVALAAPAASISVAGLDTDYRKHRVWCYGLKDATANRISLRINGDTGGNYAQQTLEAIDTSPSSARGTSQTSVQLSPSIGSGEAFLTCINVSKPAANVPARVNSTIAYSNSGIRWGARAGEWANASELADEFTILAVSGNLDTGTRLLIGGSKDA